VSREEVAAERALALAARTARAEAAAVANAAQEGQ
jgi:hypothetical protein